MPTSAVSQIQTVMLLCDELRPRRILDVGIGFGKYGVLMREILDIAKERYDRDQWQVEIGGIEFAERYRNPIWAYAYDWVEVGDAVSVLPRLGEFDLILAADMLEHLKREEGLRFVSDCLDHGKYVIICTPSIFSPQEAVHGNTRERHLSFWTLRDLRRDCRLHRYCIGQSLFLLSRHDIPTALRWQQGLSGSFLLGGRDVARKLLPPSWRAGLHRAVGRVLGHRLAG